MTSAAPLAVKAATAAAMLDGRSPPPLETDLPPPPSKLIEVSFPFQS
ncbi:hypothetical protein [Tabrizicola sp. M-4]